MEWSLAGSWGWADAATANACRILSLVERSHLTNHASPVRQQLRTWALAISDLQKQQRRAGAEPACVVSSVGLERLRLRNERDSRKQ